MAIRILLALGVLLFAGAPVHRCSAAGPNTPSAAADYSAARLLAVAQNSLATLEQADDELSRDIAFRSALTSLTGLCLLHGCKWAYPKLREIATAPDYPEMYYGISADGRLAVTIDRLKLRKPIFDEYAIYLCTFESLSAETLTHEVTGQRSLEFRLPGGTALEAEELAPDHPLWDQLSRMEQTFYPPDVLYAGSGFSFKQIFSVPAGENIGAESAVVTWGAYELAIPVFSVGRDD